MSDKQAKLLSDLAKKIKSKPKSREQIVVTLKSAKILTQNGNLTGHYSNLKKVVSISE
jgi:hypothetical protein